MSAMGLGVGDGGTCAMFAILVQAHDRRCSDSLSSGLSFSGAGCILCCVLSQREQETRSSPSGFSMRTHRGHQRGTFPTNCSHRKAKHGLPSQPFVKGSPKGKEKFLRKRASIFSPYEKSVHCMSKHKLWEV